MQPTCRRTDAMVGHATGTRRSTAVSVHAQNVSACNSRRIALESGRRRRRRSQPGRVTASQVRLRQRERLPHTSHSPSARVASLRWPEGHLDHMRLNRSGAQTLVKTPPDSPSSRTACITSRCAPNESRRAASDLVAGLETVIPFLVEYPLSERWRHLPIRANGQLALGCYLWNADQRHYGAAVLDVLTLRGDLISAVTGFSTPRLLARFGLPDRSQTDRPSSPLSGSAPIDCERGRRCGRRCADRPDRRPSSDSRHQIESQSAG
jgi:hypothetical protein